MFHFMRTALADVLSPIFSPSSHVVQMAAYCYRETDAGREVLLITSSHGRWILPKGWPIDGKSDSQTAAQEAWEEAGVKPRKVTEIPMGCYATTKRKNKGDDLPCETHVYAIEVERCTNNFPEAHKRDRRWVKASDVAKIVDDPDLSAFLTAQ